MKGVLRSECGVTLVEALLSAAIIGVFAVVLYQGPFFMQKIAGRTKTLTSSDRIISGLLENIRSNIELYQVNYNIAGNTAAEQEKLKEEFLNPEKLQMAWSNQLLTTAEECPGCPGRLGVLLRPFNAQTKGIYLVTVRMTNKELFGAAVKEFEFIVSTNE